MGKAESRNGEVGSGLLAVGGWRWGSSKVRECSSCFRVVRGSRSLFLVAGCRFKGFSGSVGDDVQFATVQLNPVDDLINGRKDVVVE